MKSRISLLEALGRVGPSTSRVRLVGIYCPTSASPLSPHSAARQYIEIEPAVAGRLQRYLSPETGHAIDAGVLPNCPARLNHF
jgi:hypothetical protein